MLLCVSDMAGYSDTGMLNTWSRNASLICEYSCLRLAASGSTEADWTRLASSLVLVVAPVLPQHDVAATTSGERGGGFRQVGERATGDGQAVVWLIEHRVGEGGELEQLQDWP